MGFPIIDEIWAGIRWLIDFFFHKAPKPILFAFFLVLLAVLSTFLSFTYHLIGVHCTSQGDVVKISWIKIGSNLQLAFMGANEPLNESAYTPQPIGVEGVLSLVGKEVCFRTICYGDDGEYHWKGMDDCDNKTIIYPYKSRTWAYFRCAVCNGTVNSTFIQGIAGASENVDLCFANAEPIPDEDKNFYQRQFCDPESQCTPPDHYYYDYLQNLYICADDNICGQNLTNQTQIVTKADQIIESADGELLYSPTLSTKSIGSTIRFACDKEGSPILSFFKPLKHKNVVINIFDYRIWLLLAVIFVMIGILTHMGQQSGLRR